MRKLLLEKKQLDYKKFGLKNNPFPYAGIPKNEPSFCANRDKELETIANVINYSFGQSSTHVALIGSYGNGKTHILRFIKSQVNKQLKSASDSRAIAGYVITPGTSFLDMYRTFMQDLGHDFFINLSWEFLGKISLAEINLRNVIEQNDVNIINETNLDSNKIKKMVEEGEILLPQVMKVARNIIRDLVKNTDVATAFLHLINENTSILAWKWLSGEQILYEQRRRLGVVSPIDSDDMALLIFQDTRKIMKYLGYDLVCLLVDEFEIIEMLHYKQKQRYLNTFRHLIDLNPEGLCLIISCTPEVWKGVVLEYHAFSERIFREVVLKPMNENSLHNLIEEYITSNRYDVRNTYPQYYPFNEDTIVEILTYSQGNMRRALALCNMAVDSAIINEETEISPECIREICE